MKLEKDVNRNRGLRTMDIAGRVEASLPEFSAQTALESCAQALRGDVQITSFGRLDGAAFQAKLALLTPEKVTEVYSRPVEPVPQRANDAFGQGHNLMVFMHRFPQVIETVKTMYSAEKLHEWTTASLKPGTRPDVWPKLIGRALYPETDDWELKDTEQAYVLAWIQKTMNDKPNEQDEKKALSIAADLVLLHPGLRSAVQSLFKRMIRIFEQKIRNIFGTSSEIVDMAYDLEVIFGNTLGIDERGLLCRRNPSVSTQRPLPERLTT